MVLHPLHKLKEASVEDVLIVTGREHAGDMIELLGGGEEFGVNLTYRIQERASGIAHALGLAKGFARDSRMLVILGDNVFSDTLSEYVRRYEQQPKGAKVLLASVSDPSRFGVPVLSGNRIVGIEEKPKQPKSPYAVAGIYMYDDGLFDIIAGLRPSGRGELEITDVNNAYLADGALTFDVLQGWWTDAGTHASLFAANQFAQNVSYSDWDDFKPSRRTAQ